MFRKITDKIYVISNTQSSNIYYLDYDQKVLIDTGHSVEREVILADMQNCDIHLENVDALLITHAHVDHVGNAAFFQAVHEHF